MEVKEFFTTLCYLNAADVLAVWGRPVEDMVTPDTVHPHGIAVPTLLTYVLVTLFGNGISYRFVVDILSGVTSIVGFSQCYFRQARQPLNLTSDSQN